jgi:hypothetical protein
MFYKVLNKSKTNPPMDFFMFYFSGKMCINMYDIRLRDVSAGDGCGMNVWPPGLTELKQYLSVNQKVLFSLIQ